MIDSKLTFVVDYVSVSGSLNIVKQILPANSRVLTGEYFSTDLRYNPKAPIGTPEYYATDSVFYGILETIIDSKKTYKVMWFSNSHAKANLKSIVFKDAPSSFSALSTMENPTISPLHVDNRPSPNPSAFPDNQAAAKNFHSLIYIYDRKGTSDSIIALPVLVKDPQFPQFPPAARKIFEMIDNSSQNPNIGGLINYIKGLGTLIIYEMGIVVNFSNNVYQSILMIVFAAKKTDSNGNTFLSFFTLYGYPNLQTGLIVNPNLSAVRYLSRKQIANYVNDQKSIQFSLPIESKNLIDLKFRGGKIVIGSVLISSKILNSYASITFGPKCLAKGFVICVVQMKDGNFPTMPFVPLEAGEKYKNMKALDFNTCSIDKIDDKGKLKGIRLMIGSNNPTQANEFFDFDPSFIFLDPQFNFYIQSGVVNGKLVYKYVTTAHREQRFNGKENLNKKLEYNLINSLTGHTTNFKISSFFISDILFQGVNQKIDSFSRPLKLDGLAEDSIYELDLFSEKEVVCSNCEITLEAKNGDEKLQFWSKNKLRGKVILQGETTKKVVFFHWLGSKKVAILYKDSSDLELRKCSHTKDETGFDCIKIGSISLSSFILSNLRSNFIVREIQGFIVVAGFQKGDAADIYQIKAFSSTKYQEVINQVVPMTKLQASCDIVSNYESLRIACPIDKMRILLLEVVPIESEPFLKINQPEYKQLVFQDLRLPSQPALFFQGISFNSDSPDQVFVRYYTGQNGMALSALIDIKNFKTVQVIKINQRIRGSLRGACQFEHATFFYKLPTQSNSTQEAFFFSEEVQGKLKDLASVERMDLDLETFIGDYKLIRAGCIPNFKGGYILAMSKADNRVYLAVTKVPEQSRSLNRILSIDLVATVNKETSTPSEVDLKNMEISFHRTSRSLYAVFGGLAPADLTVLKISLVKNRLFIKTSKKFGGSSTEATNNFKIKVAVNGGPENNIVKNTEVSGSLSVTENKSGKTVMSSKNDTIKGIKLKKVGVIKLEDSLNIKGPYYGMDIRGADKSKVQFVDRLSKAYSSQKMTSFDYIDVKGNYTLQGKTGGTVYLYKNIELNKAPVYSLKGVDSASFISGVQLGFNGLLTISKNLGFTLFRIIIFKDEDGATLSTKKVFEVTSDHVYSNAKAVFQGIIEITIQKTVPVEQTQTDPTKPPVNNQPSTKIVYVKKKVQSVMIIGSHLNFETVTSQVYFSTDLTERYIAPKSDIQKQNEEKSIRSLINEANNEKDSNFNDHEYIQTTFCPLMGKFMANMEGMEIHDLITGEIKDKRTLANNMSLPLNVFEADGADVSQSMVMEVVSPTSISKINGSILTKMYNTISDFKYLQKLPSASNKFSAYFAEKLMLPSTDNSSNDNKKLSAQNFIVIYQKGKTDPHFIMSVSLNHNDELIEEIIENSFYPNIAAITSFNKILLSNKVYLKKRYKGLRATLSGDNSSEFSINNEIQIIPASGAEIDETKYSDLVVGLLGDTQEAYQQELNLKDMENIDIKEQAKPEEEQKAGPQANEVGNDPVAEEIKKAKESGGDTPVKPVEPVDPVKPDEPVKPEEPVSPVKPENNE